MHTAYLAAVKLNRIQTYTYTKDKMALAIPNLSPFKQ